MSCRRNLRSLGLIGAIAVLGLWVRQAVAEEPPKLSYGFQKGREYMYNVKIVADFPDEELTQEGVYTCKIIDAAESQFTLQVFGSLGKQVKVKPGVIGSRGRSPFPPLPPHFGPPRFPGFGQPSRPAGTTIGRQGNLIIEGQLNSLPLLLGYAEMLFIEPLPAEARAAWNTQTGLGVVERNQSSWHHIGPFSETEVAHGATEQIAFSVLETKPASARINKKYTLHTAPEANGALKIDMTGSGQFEFDRNQGLITWQTMKYEVRVSQRNVNVTIPFTLDFHLFSAAEAAAHKKKLEEAAAAAAEAARPKPLGEKAPGERAQLLKDLDSGDPRRIKTAAQRLSKSVRDDKPDAISRALCRAMKVVDQWTQPDVMQALKIWAAADAEKTVLAAAKESNVFVSGPAIEALRHFKSAAAAEVAAAALTNLGNRHAAAEALKAMGPIAEPYVIPFADSHDVFIRGEAWNILSAIGGKKSLQVMQAQLAKAAWHEKDGLQKIIKAIEARVQSGGEETTVSVPVSPAEAAPPAASETTAAEAKPRTWHDATGTYQVEAAFVRFADGKVTLRRTNGKEVTMPLAKLSAEDRDYVEKQPKPANPFE